MTTCGRLGSRTEVRQVNGRRKRPPGRRAAATPPVELEITGLGGLGDGIGRLADGRVIMIPWTAPGDRVLSQPMGRRAGVERGRLIRVLTPSAERQEAPCPAFGQCGGCTWQHVAVTAQQRAKADRAARALAADSSLLRQAQGAPEWGYRRRVRLHLRQLADGSTGCGFMGKRSERLITTDRCPVLEPSLAEWIAPLQAWLSDRVERAEAHATVGVEGVVCAVACRPLAGAESPELEPFVHEHPNLVGLTLEFGYTKSSWGVQKVTLPETSGPLPIQVDAAGFSQASEAGNRALRAVVAAEIQACGDLRRCQEFFAGSGNLSALLAGVVRQARCVELNRAAVHRARSSLTEAGAAAGTTYELLTGDAEALAIAAGDDELWLLDPGRPGAAGLCRLATTRGPRHIIYASCAADTLGRDLRLLRSGGYIVRSATWLDTAPHTPHLEMVIRLERAPSAA